MDQSYMHCIHAVVVYCIRRGVYMSVRKNVALKCVIKKALPTVIFRSKIDVKLVRESKGADANPSSKNRDT